MKKITKSTVNIETSRALARQAIQAEWDGSYVLASLMWTQALSVCREESESLCRNRADTCNKLASLQFSECGIARQSYLS